MLAREVELGTESLWDRNQTTRKEHEQKMAQLINEAKEYFAVYKAAAPPAQWAAIKRLEVGDVRWGGLDSLLALSFEAARSAAKKGDSPVKGSIGRAIDRKLSREFERGSFASSFCDVSALDR